MHRCRLTLLLGVLFALSLTPSCHRSKSRGAAVPLAALAVVMIWNSPAAQYMLPRSTSFPKQIESLTLRHTGSAGDVEYSLNDPTGTLQASPASGVLRPGEQIVIQVIATQLAYLTAVLTLTCVYAAILNSSDKLEAALPYLLAPPALAVISILSGGDPLVPGLFFAALVFGLIGVLVKWSGTTGMNRIPLLRYTEIILVGVVLIALSLAQLRANFWRSRTAQETNAEVNFPPGQGPNGYTIHPKNEVDMVAGKFVTLFQMSDGPIPISDPDPKNLHTYTFAIDSDCDPANDWKPLPQFPNDFYKGTDRWYEIRYSKAGGWTLVVSQVDASNRVAEVASAARAILVEDSIVLVVPESELPAMAAVGKTPKYRATSFVHQGDFGANSPFLWSGDTEPAVDKPLLKIR